MRKIGQAMDRHRQGLGLLFLLFLAALAFGYGYLRLCHVDVAMVAGMFLAAGVLGCVYLGLLYRFAVRTELPLEKLYLWVAIPVVLGYLVLFAPFTVPDEQAHYLSTYRMANYFLLRWDQYGSNITMMRDVDRSFFIQFGSFTELNAQRYDMLRQTFVPFVSQWEMLEYPATIAMNAPLGYVVSALGIALGRLLHLGAIPVFYLGRLCNVAQYVVLTYWAVRKMPYGKSALMLIALLPMSLHLCASYSYDCFVLAIAMLLVAQVLSLREKAAVTWRDLVMCGVLCFLLAPSKLVYAPLILCVLLIPGERLAGLCRHPERVKAGLVLCGVVGLLVFQLANLAGYAEPSAGGNFIVWANEEGYTLSMILTDPSHMVTFVANTLWENLDYYFKTLLGGSLAWFQLDYPMYLYLPFALLLLCAFAKREGEPAALPFSQKCGLTLLVLLSGGLILASMLLSWTPLSSVTIQGVQGRYFLPCLPVVYLLVRSDLVVFHPRNDRYLLLAAGAMNVAFLAWGFLDVFQAA